MSQIEIPEDVVVAAGTAYVMNGGTYSQHAMGAAIQAAVTMMFQRVGYEELTTLTEDPYVDMVCRLWCWPPHLPIPEDETHTKRMPVYGVRHERKEPAA